MSDKEYLSSTLKCDEDEGDCRICQFLDGQRDVETMTHVIEYLDRDLFEEEELNDHLLKVINNLYEKLHDIRKGA